MNYLLTIFINSIILSWVLIPCHCIDSDIDSEIKSSDKKNLHDPIPIYVVRMKENHIPSIAQFLIEMTFFSLLGLCVCSFFLYLSFLLLLLLDGFGIFCHTLATHSDAGCVAMKHMFDSYIHSIISISFVCTFCSRKHKIIRSIELLASHLICDLR